MAARWSLALLLWCLPAGSVVIDRIAVIVDKHAIKSSDIDRDLRVTAFLNREPLNVSSDAKQKAAERLIEQTVIRDEMEKGGYSKSSAGDVDGMIKRILGERFGGSPARLAQELSRYGLTEQQLRMQLQWQLDVLKFIEQRFRRAILVTDDEVKAYYNQHQAELARQYPEAKTYEALEPKVRASLESTRLSQEFDQWLAEARKRDRIEYRQEAFQ
jgi:parvulin-like peptidyl-prolyl isomerase